MKISCRLLWWVLPFHLHVIPCFQCLCGMIDGFHFRKSREFVRLTHHGISQATWAWSFWRMDVVFMQPRFDQCWWCCCNEQKGFTALICGTVAFLAYDSPRLNFMRQDPIHVEHWSQASRSLTKTSQREGTCFTHKCYLHPCQNLFSYRCSFWWSAGCTWVSIGLILWMNYSYWREKTISRSKMLKNLLMA